MRRPLVTAATALALLAPAPALAQESATPTAGMSPAPSPSPTCTAPYGSPTARLSFSDLSDTGIVVGERVTVTLSVTGAMRTSVYLEGYEWISATEKGPLPLARVGDRAQHADYHSGDVPEGETRTHTWTLAPTGNTRVSARHYSDIGNCGPKGHHPGLTLGVINVAPRFTINAVRNGVRDYTFFGEASRPGQILSLYRVTATGSYVLTSQTRATDARTWTIHRKFLGSGRFGFVIRTGRDMANAPGASRVRDTVIH